MFANGEREGERVRLVQARQGKHCIGGSTSRERERERERERDVCVCSFLISSVCFFYSGNSSTYFKVLCRSLQKKKNLIKRYQFLSTISDPKLLGPRYNISWNSKSAERAKRFVFLKEERNSVVVIHR